MNSLVSLVLFCVSMCLVKSHSASEWRSRSIYQLLTDRFAPVNLSSSGCTAEPLTMFDVRHYCGGTYRGAIDHLDYIVEMGFNAIWISPIPSNVDEETIYGVGWHGYWLNNLHQLNEHFGSEKDLIEFVDAAHQRGIWVMLDVVTNHVGPNVTGKFFPFDQPEDYHQPLCFIEDYQNQTQVEFCTIGNQLVPLPDLNTENPSVMTTFFTWINETVRKYHFDAIRIDTFRHVSKPFWRDFVRFSSVYSLGEVASGNTSYTSLYQADVADGVLHYPLYFALNRTFHDQPQSMSFLEEQVRENEKYFLDTTLCGVFLDNHDQDRFLNHTQNPIRIENALVYLMFSDGIPIVYMGTEQNFTGNPKEIGGATDPWNRQPLWTSNYQRTTWIYQYLKQLNMIRSLLDEQFFLSHQSTLFVDNQTYAYQKTPLIVIVSNQPFNRTKFISFPSNLTSNRWKDLLSNRTVHLNDQHQLELDQWLPLLLVPIISSPSSSATCCISPFLFQ